MSVADKPERLLVTHVVRVGDGLPLIPALRALAQHSPRVARPMTAGSPRAQLVRLAAGGAYARLHRLQFEMGALPA
ncbi:MAG: hypothetical protein WHV61_06890 [Burkholderiales bacterium]